MNLAKWKLLIIALLSAKPVNKMATQFRTWVNYPEQGPQLEVNTLPSQTQPDEVLSISQMLERHSRGLPINVSEGNYYDESLGYVPDIKELDLTEIHDFRDEFAARTKAMQEEIDKREADLKAEKLAKEKEEEEMKSFFRKSQKPAEGGKPTKSAEADTD